MNKTFNLILAATFFYLLSILYRTVYWENFYLQFPQILINSFFDLSVSFAAAFSFLKIQDFLNKKSRKPYKFIFNVVGISIVYYLFVELLQTLHYYGHMLTIGMKPKFFETFQKLSFQIFDTYVVVAIGSLIFSIVIVYDKFKTEQLLKVRIEKENYKHQNDLLKKQISPHFLFNTLNNIHSLIQKENSKARFIVMKLSEILRYQIYETTVETVALEKEIFYIENYITLQSIRKEEGFQIKFDKSEIQDFKIAPLLLIVLIENAFKFSGSSENDYIHINSQLDSNGIFSFTVENSIDKIFMNKDSNANNKGFGLENLKTRLKLIYGEAARLKTELKSNTYFAKIEIKQSNTQ